MRVDSSGVKLNVEVGRTRPTAVGRPPARLPGLQPAVEQARWPRCPMQDTGSSSPTNGATASPTSRPKSTPTTSSFSRPTSRPSWTSSAWTRPHVVGHDWGAAVAWAVASFAPERVDRLVALSVGHPAVVQRAPASSSGRSPGTCCCSSSRASLSNGCRPTTGPISAAWGRHPDADAVIADLEANGSLTPGSTGTGPTSIPARLIEPPLAFPPVAVPTLGVWSTGDFALTEAPDDRLIRVRQSGLALPAHSKARGTGCRSRPLTGSTRSCSTT